jgi:glycosyltransferase involved in cell wall biosynthesis
VKVLLLTDHALSSNEAPPSRLLCLGREIARDGHAVRVVGAYSPDVPEVAGINVIALPHRANGGLRQAVFPLRKEVREQVRWCDTVIVRGYWIGLWALLYAMVLGRKRRVYDFHGMNARQQWLDRRRLRSLSTWPIEQTVLTLATTVLVISRTLREQFSRSRFRKTLLLENGVDTAPFESGHPAPETAAVLGRLGLRADRPVFVLIAHFGSWYEPEVVVQAAALAGEELELLLVGDGVGLADARRAQQRLGAANIHVSEPLPHRVVVDLLQVAYACICPYKADWCASLPAGYFVSRKVKEYFAAGKPVMCSDVPQRETFLRDGETCVLYRAGDSDDLAKRMLELARNPERARQLGARGRELAQGFSWGRLYRDSGLRALLQEGPA